MCNGGCGTVFELSPGLGGAWTEKTIYAFKGGQDAASPAGSIFIGKTGILYGTTWLGGDGYGTVFSLTRGSGGVWTEAVLYRFVNGGQPPAGLIADAEGNLYGTASGGGPNNQGLVFELTPESDGTWFETTLFTFTGGADGGNIRGGLVMDGAGNLYGTSSAGGGSGFGVVFELMKGSTVPWREHVLHSFDSVSDGRFPNAGLIFDAAGNLYGDTYSGGEAGHGSVFKLMPNSHGEWVEEILYSFLGGVDGGSPSGDLFLSETGTLYGTANLGGSANEGAVYAVRH
jgi:uncharacterized repeat protein (TIGR03803 family)